MPRRCHVMPRDATCQEVSQTVSVLALFYGTASNPALQSIPAARSLSSYDWSCQELTQSAVDEVVNAMHTDMVAKANEKNEKGE